MGQNRVEGLITEASIGRLWLSPVTLDNAEASNAEASNAEASIRSAQATPSLVKQRGGLSIPDRMG